MSALSASCMSDFRPYVRKCRPEPTTNDERPPTILVFMPFAADARTMHHCRLSANFAAGACRGHSRRRLVGLQQVLSPDIAGGEYGNKRGRRGRLLDTRTPSRLLAYHQAQYAHHLKAEFPRRFDRLHGRGPGSANVVDNHYARAFFLETFNAPSGAVLLLGFANQKSVHVAAGDRNRYHDRIGPHGQAADRFRLPSPVPNP